MTPTHALPSASGLDESNCQTIHPSSWDSPLFLPGRAIRSHPPRRQNNRTMVLALASGRVMSEDKVASFDRLVAEEAGFEQRLVGRFAVFELSKPQPPVRHLFSSP